MSAKRLSLYYNYRTMVSVVSKTDAPGNADTRFVPLRADFDTAIADAGHRREIVKNRSELRSGGMFGNKYVGDKWGGKYMRAPDIYHHIMDNYSDKLVRLGDVATVRRGHRTGRLRVDCVPTGRRSMAVNRWPSIDGYHRFHQRQRNSNAVSASDGLGISRYSDNRPEHVAAMMVRRQ